MMFVDPGAIGECDATTQGAFYRSVGASAIRSSHASLHHG